VTLGFFESLELLLLLDGLESQHLVVEQVLVVPPFMPLLLGQYERMGGSLFDVLSRLLTHR